MKAESKCPFCLRKLQNKNGEIKVSDKFSYLVCDRCDGGVLIPPPTKKQLQKIYNSTKYFEELATPARNPVVQWILTRRLFKTPSEWVNKSFPRGRILDVGCGNGEFLEELKRFDWEVWGSDVSVVASKNTAGRIGEDRIKVGVFPQQRFGRMKFDIVSFWHVLEHVDNPSLYLKKAKELLSEDGCIVGEVPNFDSPLIKLFQSNYSWVMVPEHRLYFSVRSLRSVLRESGYNQIRIFCPPRALLNFYLSVNKYLKDKSLPLVVKRGVLVISLPISILLGILFALANRGEVLRFVAKK